MIFSYRSIACTVISIILSNSLLSQEQSLIRDCIIPATGEHDTISLGLMIPSSMKDEGQKYPVIFFLHGLNGQYSGWQSQKVAEFIRLNSQKGIFPECIVVFPDGGEGFWCNHYDGDPLLEDEIIDFIIPYIDQNYSIDADKRLIMGWSAGGAGAMFLFSKHPGLFKAAVSFDGSIMPWEDFLYFQGNRPEIVRDSAYYYEHCSPNEWLVRNKNIIKEKQDTSLFLTAALLAPYHQDFLTILKDEGIPYYYKKMDCNHEFGCVFSGISNDLLIFLSESLK